MPRHKFFCASGHASNINAVPYGTEQKSGHAIDCDMCVGHDTNCGCKDNLQLGELRAGAKSHFEIYQMQPSLYIFHLNTVLWQPSLKQSCSLKYNLFIDCKCYAVRRSDSEDQRCTQVQANHCILALELKQLCMDTTLKIVCLRCTQYSLQRVCCSFVCAQLSLSYQLGQVSVHMQPNHQPLWLNPS